MGSVVSSIRNRVNRSNNNANNNANVVIVQPAPPTGSPQPRQNVGTSRNNGPAPVVVSSSQPSPSPNVQQNLRRSPQPQMARSPFEVPEPEPVIAVDTAPPAPAPPVLDVPGPSQASPAVGSVSPVVPNVSPVVPNRPHSIKRYMKGKRLGQMNVDEREHIKRIVKNRTAKYLEVNCGNPTERERIAAEIENDTQTMVLIVKNETLVDILDDLLNGSDEPVSREALDAIFERIRNATKDAEIIALFTRFREATEYQRNVPEVVAAENPDAPEDHNQPEDGPN